jgi:hypothetical protein
MEPEPRSRWALLGSEMGQVEVDLSKGMIKQEIRNRLATNPKRVFG